MTIQMEIAAAASAIDQENKFQIMVYDNDSFSSDVKSNLDNEESDDHVVFKETHSYSSSNNNNSHDALGNMSDLIQQLPCSFNRGLSKHFEGKSQSFTCLSKVKCLKDLAKPENPYKKRLKSCKSYVGLSSPPVRTASSSNLNFSQNISSEAAN